MQFIAVSDVSWWIPPKLEAWISMVLRGFLVLQATVFANHI